MGCPTVATKQHGESDDIGDSEDDARDSARARAAAAAARRASPRCGDEPPRECADTA